MYEVERLPQNIDIGFTGEIEFRTVEIDMSAWVAKVPDGQPTLMYIRPGEYEPYPVEITFEDNILTWSVSDEDLGTKEGTGLLQVWFGVEDEEQVLRQLGMSAVVATIVHLSIAGEGNNSSTVQIPWLKEVMEMKNIILGYDYEAESWAVGKRGGTDVSSTDQAYHNNAKYFSEQASAAKTAAEAAQEAAETAAERDVEAWLEENFTNPDSPPLDRTLALDTAAAPADMVGNLKSALSDRTLFADTAFSESIFQLRKGSAVNSAGRYASDSNAVAGYGSEKCPFVHAGTKITANEGYKFSYALWDIPVSANANVSHNIIVVRDIAAGTTVTIPQDAYIAFSCKKADDSALPSDKTAYEFANEAVTVELYIRTSKTEINKMEEQIATHEGIINAVNSWVGKNNNPVASLAGCFILSKNVCKNTDYTDGYYIKPDGSLVANASFKVSDYFMVEPNTQYYLYNSSSTIVFYDFDKNYIWGVDKSVSTTVVTSPANACFARYSTGGATSTWNVSKGTDYIDTPYFEPYLDLTGFASSPYYKGRFNISKPDVHGWYECECLKDNYNAFDFHLGSDTAHTGTQYADVLALLDELVSAAEPGYITKTAIGTGSGTDINGNPYTLYEYAFVPKAYSASLSNKKHPKILLDCAIHGFEKNTTFGIFALLYDVVHNWQKNSFLATLRHFVEIRWVPVSDPYGFDNNIRNNANGVNLNRNFPADGWTPGSGINYGGESPLDQPEAAALAAWFQANPDMLFYINFHVNGHYYSEGYNEANACMPYTNIGDDYYNKLFNAIKRHIERQTAELPTEFDLLTPSHSQFIGQLQASPTSTSGYVDQYVCAYLKSALAMTIEGCNYLRIDSNTEMSFNTGTIKMNAEMFGNIIEEILYEYLD